MRVVPSFLLDTGATLSAAQVHAVVDNAEVYDLLEEDIDLSQAGILVGTTYTAILPSAQVLSGEPVAVFHTGASMYPASLYFGIAAGKHEMAAHWHQRSGPGVQSVPVGWPICIPHNDQVWGDSLLFQGQEIADYHLVPYISADPRLVYPHWTSSTGGGKGMLPGDPVFINMQAVTAIGYTKVLTLGFADALVHYSLSSSFSPGDLYALYHSDNAMGVSVKTRVPISWHGSNHSGVTMSFLPYGLIRKVFTDSGVTNVAMPVESTIYSLAAQPFFVARVWFWGSPSI